MHKFPTNIEPFRFYVVALHIVQCFRRGQGFTLLAHVCKGFSTWCMIVADAMVAKIRDAFDFRAVLLEVA